MINQDVHVCMLSGFSCAPLCVMLWTVAHEAPLSMAFSRQEYWSELPCPSPGHLPDPGIETASPTLQVSSLPLSHRGSPNQAQKPSKHVAEFLVTFHYRVSQSADMKAQLPSWDNQRLLSHKRSHVNSKELRNGQVK